jgi:hypothetical protein
LEAEGDVNQGAESDDVVVGAAAGVDESVVGCVKGS